MPFAVQWDIYVADVSFRVQGLSCISAVIKNVEAPRPSIKPLMGATEVLGPKPGRQNARGQEVKGPVPLKLSERLLCTDVLLGRK